MLFSAIVAVVTAVLASRHLVIALLAIGLALPIIWKRPIVFRFWVVLTTGLGSGLAWFGYLGERHYYESDFGMTTDELSGWGVGMLLGGVAAYWLFLRRPPE